MSSPAATRHRRRYFVRTTAAIRQQLVELRRLCGERGYLVYPVAPWYRRTAYDFVTFPKDSPQMLIVVRPNKQGQIELRSYVLTTQHYHLTKAIRGRKVKHCPVIWQRQLPAIAKNPANDWKWFLSKMYQNEVS